MFNTLDRLFWAIYILLALLIFIINSRGLMGRSRVR